MSPIRFIMAAMAVLCLAQPVLAASAEQTRIDQAVRAYAAKLESDAEKDHDQRALANAAALQSDPLSPVIGNQGAATTVVEFFDYACPYCKAVEPRLEATIRADKNARLVLKEFPILTPASMVATRAALAAAKQGKYTPFHQALMNYRGQLDGQAITDTAKAVHLDMARLEKDMNSPDITNEIIANFNLARALRIFQTPGFIVGNHILGGQSADINFSKEISLARGK